MLWQLPEGFKQYSRAAPVDSDTGAAITSKTGRNRQNSSLGDAERKRLDDMLASDQADDQSRDRQDSINQLLSPAERKEMEADFQRMDEADKQAEQEAADQRNAELEAPAERFILRHNALCDVFRQVSSAAVSEQSYSVSGVRLGVVKVQVEYCCNAPHKSSVATQHR